MYPPTTFRAFKRHYHKIRKIAEELFDKGSFNLNISIGEQKLKAEFKTPDHDATIRFIVLMRRFLNPADLLFYQKVWSMLLDEFTNEIPGETAQQVNALISQLKKGDIGINVNGEDLTPEKIYQTIANGEYFHRDKDAQIYLQRVSGVPIIGPVFWQQFHAYTLAGYGVASALFSVISIVEKSQKYQESYISSPQKKYRCIYCLTTDASFTSEEHIFPESLGNDELVLPKGCVCDKCNNETLALLDNELLKFGPVAMLQVQYVPYTKDGKLPSANFQNLSMKRTGPQNITIQIKDKTAQIKNRKDLGDGWVTFSFDMRGNRLEPKVLGRALYKIALGMVAFSQGQEKACDAKYDLARSFIQGKQGFPNNLIIKTKCKPHPQVHISYHDLPQGTPFGIDIYGLIFLINIEPEPVLQLNEIINDSEYSLYPLHD